MRLAVALVVEKGEKAVHCLKGRNLTFESLSENYQRKIVGQVGSKVVLYVVGLHWNRPMLHVFLEVKQSEKKVRQLDY